VVVAVESQSRTLQPCINHLHVLFIRFYHDTPMDIVLLTLTLIHLLHAYRLYSIDQWQRSLVIDFIYVFLISNSVLI
jgi:hypothetical protein